MRAVLFDLDGVLYEGERPVAGAKEAVEWFAGARIPHLFVTNTTSRPRRAIAEKLRGYGLEVDAHAILSPPVAARAWLERHAPGPVALFVPEATREEFAGLEVLAAEVEEGAAAVVLGDLGPAWDFAALNRAFRLLAAEPRPQLVALGMTRYWRAPDGLRLDVAPFVVALEHAAEVRAEVLGKPARAFFRIALERLGMAEGETLMVGDDIRADVEAGQQAGLRTALVRTGKFRPVDLETGIRPDAVLDSVAELPAWWRERA